MGIITVSLPSDGTTADVSDINTPITTIVTAINGNLDATNLTDGAITYAKLISTIFGGQVQTQTNAGTAGGTMYYVNLGGIKILYATGTAVSTNASGNQYTFTLPSGFFSSIRYIGATATNMTNDIRQYCSVASSSTTTVTVACIATNGTATTQVPTILVIGT